MRQTWRARLIVAACLTTPLGCNGTARPMVFHRNDPEPAVCCPVGTPIAGCEGPMLEGMPLMGSPAMGMPGMTMPGMTMPPPAVAIPGSGMTLPPATTPPPVAAPPAAPPPVGPQPRTAPAQQTSRPAT